MTEEKHISVNKATFDNSWYDPGASRLKIIVWYFVNALFVLPYFNPLSGLKKSILRAFGARIGKGCLIKPGVNVKYPWNLQMGDYSSLGERAWVDNLVPVILKDHVTVSQGALLLTGNHDYKSVSFDLQVGQILLEDGVWICAKAIVGPGVTCRSHSVLGLGSIAMKDLEPYTVYSGMPAEPVRERILSTK